MGNYIIGQKTTLRGKFLVDGSLTAFANVRLNIKNPSGTVTPITSGITNPSLGTYEYDYTWNAAGDWFYWYEDTVATGTIARAKKVRVDEQYT